MQLYRGILQLHRMLPGELKHMGDAYVRNEFRLHKKVTDATLVDTFIKEWAQYRAHLRGQIVQEYGDDGKKLSSLGRKIEQIRLSQMNDDQLYTLMELRNHASFEADKEQPAGRSK